MPIYEYECKKCGHRMEAIQKLSDKPFTRCPECKGALKKLISSPAFQFKGSGWYVTDYADKKGGAAKGDGESDGSSSAGSSGSSGGGESAGDKAGGGGSGSGKKEASGAAED